MNNGIVLYLKSGYILFDDEDFELIAAYNWRVNSSGYVTYLQYTKRVKKPKGLLLHRMILGITNRDEVGEHKNHNPQDNRRCNIRKATVSQNMMNRSSNKIGTSKYLGVSFDKSKGKWRAQIKANNKRYLLGRFKDEVEAAIAYNNAASIYFGEFANLNKID